MSKSNLIKTSDVETVGVQMIELVAAMCAELGREMQTHPENQQMFLKSVGELFRQKTYADRGLTGIFDFNTLHCRFPTEIGAWNDIQKTRALAWGRDPKRLRQNRFFRAVVEGGGIDSKRIAWRSRMIPEIEDWKRIRCKEWIDGLDDAFDVAGYLIPIDGPVPCVFGISLHKLDKAFQPRAIDLMQAVGIYVKSTLNFGVLNAYWTAPLTDCEREVMELQGAGMQLEEIAAKTNRKYDTVQRHSSTAKRKLRQTRN